MMNYEHRIHNRLAGHTGQAREDAADIGEEADREIASMRKDAELLAWVLLHPETAAECLQDAAAGDGSARENLERRMVALMPTRKDSNGQNN